MGICLTANNSKYSFNMSYGSFHNLRRNIATAIDPEFGELYHKQLAALYVTDSLEAENEIVKLLADEERFPDTLQPIINFLYESDCEGSVDYRTCKAIYDLIKDVDFEDKNFQYVSYRVGQSISDYEKFKEFLRECYRYHRHMRWY